MPSSQSSVVPSPPASQCSSTPSSNVKKVRIVSADHYIARPVPGLDEMYTEFRLESTYRVPVIRIFGVTEKGRKACLHVHGIYPYLSIQFKNPEKLIHRKLAECLDSKLTPSSSQESEEGNNPTNEPGASTSTNKSSNNKNRSFPHVHRIEEYKGTSLYGYHENEESFLKISFYNPRDVTLTADLMTKGQVIGEFIQPFQAHIPYTLQFFIDYDLSGMNFILFENEIEREDWVDPNWEQPVGGKPRLQKTTSCELEMDINCRDVLNSRMKLKSGLDLIWDEEEERCRRAGKQFVHAIEDADDRPVKEIYGREAKFLDVLDQIIGIKDPTRESTPPHILPTQATTATKSSDDLLAEFEAVALDLLEERNNNDQSIRKRPREIADDIDSPSDHEEEYDSQDDMNETHIMSQRIGDVLSRPQSNDTTPSNSPVKKSPVKTPVRTNPAVVATDEEPKEIPERNDGDSILFDDDDEGYDLPVPSTVALSKNDLLEDDTLSQQEDETPPSKSSGELTTKTSTTTTTSGEYSTARQRFSDHNESDKSEDDDIPEDVRIISHSRSQNRTSSPSVVSRGSSPDSISKIRIASILERSEEADDDIEWDDDEELAKGLMTVAADDAIEGQHNIEDEPIDWGDEELERGLEEINTNTVNALSPDKKIPQFDGGCDESELSCSSSKNSKSRKRIRKEINGVSVLLPADMTLEQLEQISNSHVCLERTVITAQLTELMLGPDIIVEVPSPKPRDPATKKPNIAKIPPSKTLVGRDKTEYLLSLCKPFDIKSEPETALPTHSTADDDVCSSQGTIIIDNSDTEQENYAQESRDPEPKNEGSSIPTENGHTENNNLDRRDHIHSALNDENESGSIYSICLSYSMGSTHRSQISEECAGGNNDSREDIANITDGNFDFSTPKTATKIPTTSTPYRKKHFQSRDIRVDSLPSPILEESSQVAIHDRRTSRHRVTIMSAEEYQKAREVQEHEHDRKTPQVVEETAKMSVFTRRLLAEKTKRKARNRRCMSFDSVLSGPSQGSQLSHPNFAVNSPGSSLNTQVAKCSPHEYQYVTIMSMEIYIDTRKDLCPDPKQDAIRAIFYSWCTDAPNEEDSSTIRTALVIVDGTDVVITEAIDIEREIFRTIKTACRREDVQITHHTNEVEAIFEFIEVVRRIDPDIILGWEVEMSSWGFLLDRASTLNLQISTGLSRLLDVQPQKWGKPLFSSNPPSKISIRNTSLHFTGRILFNLWHVMRHEVTLTQYSFENCYMHILHEKTSSYTYQTLTSWFNGHRETRMRVVDYYVKRTEGSIKMMMRLGIISRTSTLARVYGIQFNEVLSRGSQFRVESMMLRYAKRKQLIPISPSVQQVKDQDTPEYIPLVMEPCSKFYADPVVVLDFQSLYPSMMIAYNYCYSTCLGKIARLKNEGAFKFGVSEHTVSKTLLKSLRPYIHIAPCGTAFVKPSVRRGILPQMLEEILSTRIMVKDAMKENMGPQGTQSKSLDCLLDARQLALKLVANVTYGYTAANFSGRMPCGEIADAIVSKGKETLIRAIKYIDDHTPRWGGKVVYGDTDSVFIVFPGLSKAETFRRGREIAKVITKDNPSPVKLKFERVFYPSILVAKKRYVGYAYESEDQKTPEFLAKGIETIRRDNCPATAKIMENALRVLFDGFDQTFLSVKPYLQRQFSKMMSGKISFLHDFVFAKEYRGRDKYSKNARVPALELTKKALKKDPRAEPRDQERVPYVIVAGHPNQNIIELVRSPMEVVNNPALKLNIPYYIERVFIPALNRIFKDIMNTDVSKWYHELPRKTSKVLTSTYHTRNKQALKQPTISQYFQTASCPACGGRALKVGSLCDSCKANPAETALAIVNQLNETEMKQLTCQSICQSCSGVSNGDNPCTNVTCSNLFRRSQAQMAFNPELLSNHRKLLEALGQF